jgi:hypothetical protein
MIRVALVDESGRLMTIDAFRQVAMEEHVLDVKLVYGPASGCSKMKNSPNSQRFDDGGEGLMKINPSR